MLLLRRASCRRLTGCIGARLHRRYATAPVVAEAEEAALVLDERRQGLLRRTFLDYMPHSAFEANPLVVERAKGLYYWDVTGKRFFDAIGGIFTVSLGHGHPAVVDAVKRQVDLMTFAPPMHGIADVTFDFIEKLSDVTPAGMDYVKTYSGASEAMESAIKFSRQYWKQSGQPGKYKFISRYQSYHGCVANAALVVVARGRCVQLNCVAGRRYRATMGAMSASGTGMRKTPFEPQMPGFLKLWPPTYFQERLPDGTSWEEVNRICAHMFEDVIVNEDASTVAGIILEPIGNTGGLITPTEEYFSIVRSICDRHNVHLILDETITGFCKTGSMFGCDSFNVVPDIIVTGKGVSNGIVPLAAMICQVDMASAFLDEPTGEGAPPPANFFAHGHTFANNPLACAVGTAVLNEMTTHSLDVKAQRLGDIVFNRLSAMQEKFGCIKEVRGRGILRGVLLVKDRESNEPWPELGVALKSTAMHNGIIMRIDPTWFTVAPALCAEEEDIHEMCDLIEQSLGDALQMVR